MDQVRNFGFLVKDVARLWTRHFELRAAQLGMSLTQCKVLVYLSRNEGTTQARLAELSDTDPMTLVRVLDRMERDGWIERRADPADRRAYRLFRKPASDAVLTEITRIAEKARGEGLAGLSAEQRQQMVEMLEHVRRNLVALLPANDVPAPRQKVSNRARRIASSRTHRSKKTSS